MSAQEDPDPPVQFQTNPLRTSRLLVITIQY
jgi:hypothetical protein